MRVELKIRKLNEVREKLPGHHQSTDTRHKMKIVHHVPGIV